MLLVINPAPTYHIVGSVNGANIKVKLDTGASVCLISECTWNKLTEQTELTNWHGKQLVRDKGSPIPIIGVAACKVCFPGVNVQDELIVAKSLSTEAILGVDCLEQSQCIVDAKQKVQGKGFSFLKHWHK